MNASLGRWLFVALLASLVNGSLAAQGPTPAPAASPTSLATSHPTLPERGKPAGAAVIFDGQYLFEVAEGLGSFTPEERAKVISARIAQLAEELDTGDLKLGWEPGTDGVFLLGGDRLIMLVTEADARAAGVSAEELAARYAKTIEEAIARKRERTSLRVVVRSLLYALVLTIVFAALMRVLPRAFRAAERRVQSWRGTVISSIQIQNLELLNADQITVFLVFLVRLLRIVFLVFTFSVYFSLVLGFFPQTQGWAKVLAGYALAPLQAVGKGFVGFLPNFFFVVVIIILTRYILKGFRFLFKELERGSLTLPGFQQDWAQPTYKIVRFLVLVFAVIAIFPYLPGSDSLAFKGISVFLGLLFSLGSSSAIANIVAGVILTYTGAFRVGDRVRIADAVGDVLEKTLLVTRLRTVKNVVITIPNSMVLGSQIVNYSSTAKSHGLILHTTVSIGYNVPWRQVHQLLIEAAEKTEGILRDPKPFVLQLSLGDYAVTYELNAFTADPSGMSRIYSDLHAHIQDAFNKAGVEILSPGYTAIRDGNEITVPPEYLPRGYSAPAFRLASVAEQGQEAKAKKEG